MNVAEGYLCDTCISALKGDNEIKEWNDHFTDGRRIFNNYHHQKYRDLAVSKDEYYFICTWLWNMLPIQPDSESLMSDGLRIYCSVHRPDLAFHVVCPWDVGFQLKVSMCGKREVTSKGTSAPSIWTLLDARPWADLVHFLSEWQQEAKAMVDIYRHSFCNISAIAASSDSSSTGLFSKRRLPSRLLFPFTICEQHLDDETGFNVGPWVFYNDSSWMDEIESTPLNTRGLVVQERFLAPRILHFTKNQVYWECLDTTVCEADPNWKLQILAKDFLLRQPIQTVYQAAG
ncbi:heterokaryon incompatibility protein [Fusarium oxysporum f. sp. phaseoli]